MAVNFADAWKSHILQDFRFPQKFPQGTCTPKPYISPDDGLTSRRKHSLRVCLTLKLPQGCEYGALNRARTTQNTRRQEKQRGKQGKHAVYCDADDAEWQRDEPNDGKEHDRQQSERPAQDKQDAPKKKCGHVRPPDLITYARLEKFHRRHTDSNADVWQWRPEPQHPWSCVNLPPRSGAHGRAHE